MMGVFVQVNVTSRQAKSNPIGYVIQENGCWEWVGYIDRHGYGVLDQRRAHRVVYERAKGPIPEGLQTDHLCRNRKCVNPDHLELVTSRENTLRGNSFVARQARQTHCIRGHEFTMENTLRTSCGKRQCRACSRAYKRPSQRAAEAALAAWRKK